MSRKAGVAVVGEFDLDLRPLGGAAVAGEAFGVHGVDADLGEEPAGGVEEVAYVAVGAEPDHGPQLVFADTGADEAGEALREVVGERGAELVAHSGGDGELQVPAGVGAAGAAAQGEGGRRQAFVGGVVVGGVEVGDSLVHDGGDAGDARQVGQSALVGLVFPLDFPLGVRHEPNVVAGSAERQVPPRTGGVRSACPYADIGRCTLIDWSRPTASHTANMDDPP
ncbi:hypothetical protein GCM10019016_051760 [Streptomyces prasinosporus]|uniref:Uncharacterized protein n=1 Tax=Streptomyces prasinosporus TaxID=68256 RepID=A0ABP6TU98_9ACTN